MARIFPVLGPTTSCVMGSSLSGTATIRHRRTGDPPDEITENGGPFRYHHSRKLRYFTDGTSNTLIISEVIAGRVDNPNIGKIDFRGIWAWPDIASGYLHVETPNSSVLDCLRDISCGDPTMEVSPCSPTCQECDGRPTARSFHPGGVIFRSRMNQPTLLWERFSTLRRSVSNRSGESIATSNAVSATRKASEILRNPRRFSCSRNHVSAEAGRWECSHARCPRPH